MTAYTHDDLYNLEVRQQAKEALHAGYITPEQYRQIAQSHQVSLYMPGIFVRIGLGLLTLFIVFACLGLLALILDVKESFDLLLIFMGVACYTVLEIMTQSKKHYNSGVDNILLLAVPSFILAGIGLYVNGGEVFLSLVSILIFAWLTIRFADSIMAVGCFASIVQFVFSFSKSIGVAGTGLIPLLLVVVAACLLFACRRGRKDDRQIIYQWCYRVAEAASLASLYAFGNVYVASAINKAVFANGEFILLNGFFWAWTVLVPIVFLYLGVRQKNLLLLRLGGLSMAATIITYRYYYAIAPLEVALITAGTLLTAVVYWLMRFLSTSKYDFVFEEQRSQGEDTDNLEAYLVSEAFGNKDAVPNDSFGGGSFGGAGAGSKY